MADKLPGVLASGLRILFCGTAAGNKSAATGCYHTKSCNCFWSTIGELGL